MALDIRNRVDVLFGTEKKKNDIEEINFDEYGRMDSKTKQALEQFKRPAFYGTSLQCPKRGLI